MVIKLQKKAKLRLKILIDNGKSFIYNICVCLHQAAVKGGLVKSMIIIHIDEKPYKQSFWE